jgi:hypothetical protein
MALIRKKRSTARFKPVKKKRNTHRTGKPIGRPKCYNKEVGDFICEEIAKGRTLTKICLDTNLPHIMTIHNWKNPLHKRYEAAFALQYDNARKIQAEVWADETKDIADDGKNDTYQIYNPKRGRIETFVDHDVIARSTLRIKARQWLAGKHNAKFSDKVSLTGENGSPLIPSSTKIVVNFVKSTTKELESKKEK